MNESQILTKATAKMMKRNRESFLQRVTEQREEVARIYTNGKPATFYLKTDLDDDIKELIDVLPREKDITRSNVVEAALRLLFKELDNNNEEVKNLIYSTKNA